MLQALREILAQRGYLSADIIDETKGFPASTCFGRRFGSLVRAYELIGYVQNSDVRYVTVRRDLRVLYSDLFARIVAGIEHVGGRAKMDPLTRVVTINEEITASVLIARCRKPATKSPRWDVRLHKRLPADISIIVGLDPENRAPRDYFLIPQMDPGRRRLSFGEHSVLDCYRFKTLETLFQMAAHLPLKETLDAQS